jgi:enamine deaminase RidA (YjgF/YER057c/UK114 family)
MLVSRSVYYVCSNETKKGIKEMSIKRTNYSSGAPLEDIAGYSRAVSAGPFIYVGGTTSVQPDGSVIGEHDSYAQMKYILNKQITFIEKAGGTKDDVFSVKCYVTPDYDGKAGAKAYSEIFKGINPLFTVVTIEALNRPTQLVEVEMNAVAGCSMGAYWENIKLERTNYSSGAPMEAAIGYSRMVKIGPFVYVGGTTSVQPDGSVFGELDSRAQQNYILEKQVKLLEKAGAAAADIVKIKSYATPSYKKYMDKEKPSYYEKVIKPVKPLLTGVTIFGLNRASQLVEIEMMAVIGCGSKEKNPLWGNIDFTRTNYSSGAPLEDKVGYSRMVKVGPFAFIGGTTSVQPDGSVAGEGDSRAQENYVFEKELKLLEQVGMTRKDVIKVKNYHAPAYKKNVKKETESFYAATLKHVKPLYTAVTIAGLNRPTQMVEIEMMAMDIE